MKKKSIIAVLSALLLVGCSSSIEARPNVVKDEDVLVEVTENNKTVDIYNNEFTDLYESLVEAGTTNTNIVNEMVQIIAKREIGVHASKADKTYKSFSEKNFISEERFNELVDEYMVDLVLSGSYTEDYLFHEEKFAREQRESLYTIKDNDGNTTEEKFNSPMLLTPGIEFVDVFGSDIETDENTRLQKGREKYQDYREKVVEPVIYKRLLTSKYLMENRYRALGRAAAREVRVISIDNSKPKDSGSAIKTLNNYIGGYLYVTHNQISNPDSYFPCVQENGNWVYNFDIDSLARIWKGVYSDDTSSLSALEMKELEFINGKNSTLEKLYTENQETIVDEITEIAEKDPTSGKWNLKSGLNMDNEHISELVSKYTGTFSYPVDWGVTLAEREIQSKDIVDDDFVIEKTGLTSLPSDIRTRLFQVSVEKNIKTVNNTNFLMPEKKANTGTTVDYSKLDNCIADAANYVHYDSSSKTYYVVIVDAYNYSTSSTDLGTELTDSTREKALEVAILLGDDSSHQNDAIIHYLKKEDSIYDICFHDEDFYDYMKSSYAEIFED